jgi:outer membrane protein OmpA-like peptidoglycan-associated protein
VKITGIIVSLVALAAPALAQQPSSAPEISGRESGVGFRILDLQGRVQDLAYTVVDLAGKAKDLQIKETKTEIHIELAADVLFDFDKADIRPTAQEALKQAAAVIRANARGQVRIEGHTDSKGSDPLNQKLSERRALSVRNWLVGKEGLASVKFSTQGFGAKRPVAPNSKPDGSDDPDGRQKNRRVEIIIAKG